MSHRSSISKFYCGWISTYKEESEYLFMGGHYQLAVSNITCIETRINYVATCKILSVLEMFTQTNQYSYDGTRSDTGYYERLKLDDESLFVLKSLIESRINPQKYDVDKFDTYARNAFELFSSTKKKLYFNLGALSWIHIDIRSYFLEMISGITNKEYDKGMFDAHRNLFKKEIFDVFPNIEEIEIYSGCFKDEKFYYVSPLDLLPKFKNHKIKRIAIKYECDNGSTHIPNITNRSTSNRITNGSFATLTGLSKDRSMNGRIVQVIKFVEAKNRWIVNLLDKGRVARLGVYEGNLKALDHSNNNNVCRINKNIAQSWIAQLWKSEDRKVIIHRYKQNDFNIYVEGHHLIIDRI